MVNTTSCSSSDARAFLVSMKEKTRTRARARARKRLAKRKRQKIIKTALKVSEGLLSTAMDMVLSGIFFSLEFGASGGKAWLADKNTQQLLDHFNYSTLKQALLRLERKGLIQTIREKQALPKITAAGEKRLNSLLPQYDAKRVWDKRIYLVIYDLPREKNAKRNLLRKYLRKIGCGMLQHSVWLTPYNPTKLISDFAIEHGLGDWIIVSSIGKDGTIGDRDLAELLDEVYKLTELNLRYGEFISQVKSAKLTRHQLIFAFLSILQDDPQLPFELLPHDWLGEQAYEIFLKATSISG